jgi:hypothetical protein
MPDKPEVLLRLRAQGKGFLRRVAVGAVEHVAG